eukprot:gb/GFBE01044596.1/.p1 GENE.gb/GFBE01044596.1/~~gb/GFBE01044596.1/.p1  ORF type:complete len:329 (+),score=82.00 gb/GFBE01044596.1/:1-987(+)
MGAEVTKLSTECNCCAPDDPNTELNVQYTRPVDPVNSVFARDVPNSSVAASPATASSAEAAAYKPSASAWGSPEEEEGFFVPPPPPEPETSSPTRAAAPPKAAAKSSSKSEPKPAPKPTSPKPKPAPKPAPAPAAAAAVAKREAPKAPAGSSSSRGGPGAGAFEAMLDDLEGAEQAAYSAAFQSLSGGQNSLQPDHEQLRNFVLIHSGVGEQDLDMELLKIASTRDDFAIDANSFVMLLREHPIADSEALNLFMNVSQDGETISAEDCRTCLLQLMNKLPETDIKEDRLERIFDTVMVTAGLSVPMEQWLGFSKTTARILRLMAYTQA